LSVIFVPTTAALFTVRGRPIIVIRSTSTWASRNRTKHVAVRSLPSPHGSCGPGPELKELRRCPGIRDAPGRRSTGLQDDDRCQPRQLGDLAIAIGSHINTSRSHRGRGQRRSDPLDANEWQEGQCGSSWHVSVAKPFNGGQSRCTQLLPFGAAVWCCRLVLPLGEVTDMTLNTATALTRFVGHHSVRDGRRPAWCGSWVTETARPVSMARGRSSGAHSSRGTGQ
jgi:hypothetical protein